MALTHRLIRPFRDATPTESEHGVAAVSGAGAREPEDAVVALSLLFDRGWRRWAASSVPRQKHEEEGQ
jgi:hypothetical protein